MTFWLLYLLMLLSMYECNLRAYLVTVNTEPPIDSADDILSQGKRLFLPRGQTALISIFENSKNLALQTLFKVSKKIS